MHQGGAVRRRVRQRSLAARGSAGATKATRKKQLHLARRAAEATEVRPHACRQWANLYLLMSKGGDNSGGNLTAKLVIMMDVEGVMMIVHVLMTKHLHHIGSTTMWMPEVSVELAPSLVASWGGMVDLGRQMITCVFGFVAVT